MNAQDDKRVGRGGLSASALVFSSLTMVSRALGYARDAVIFIVFGAGGITDAFLVAFRLPNFLRRLFAEGAFSQSFVPVLSDVKTREGRTQAREVIALVAGPLLVALGVITLIGVLVAPWLIVAFAPGFAGDARFDTAGDLLRITFPYILFISATALCSGALNTFGRFAVPALTPTLLNLSLIGAALWLAPRFDEPITALAWGVFVAGMAQLGVQLLALRRLGLLPRPRINLRHPAVRRVARLLWPAMLGSSVIQVNLLVDTIIASLLADGSISWLYLSDRFVELPVGLFAIALSVVLLPRLSQHYAAGDHGGFNRALSWGGGGVVLLALPCFAGLVILSEAILMTLMQYREFTDFDTRMASASLVAYTVGLPAFMLVKVLNAGLFSRQDTRLPTRIALVAMVANLVMNIAFVGVWRLSGWSAEHAALALATCFSAWLQCALLYRAVQRNGYALPAELRRIARQCLIATVVMAVLLLALTPDAGAWRAWSAVERGAALAGLVFAGAAAYAAVLYACGFRKHTLGALEG